MKTSFEIPRIEDEIKSVYQNIQPDDAFKQKLRVELAARAAARPTRKFSIWQVPRLRFAYGFGMILIILVIIFAVDPQSFLAQARSFFRFIPGIGFVERTNARALCAPVETQEGDLNVKILAAGGSGRNLHFSFSATYPSGERQIGYAIYDDMGNKANMLGGGGGGGGGDGGPITVNGSGDFLLTSDSNHLIMVINQGLPDGGTLGEVRVPFDLCPVSDLPEERGSTPGAQTPTGQAVSASVDYTPQGAEDTKNGIVMRVVQVSQNEQGTGIQVQAVIDPGAEKLAAYGSGSVWVYPYGMLERNLALTDDTGREYALQDVHLMNDLHNPSLSSHQFDPLAKDSRQATLTVREVTVLFENRPVPFTFDPGGMAHLGQVWDQNQLPDQTYNLNGFELRFLEASYDKQSKQIDAETFSDMYTLTFKVKTRPPSPKMTLACVRINFADAITECSWSSEEDVMILRTSFMEDIGDRVITGNLDSVNASIEGPWKITWDVPHEDVPHEDVPQ